MDQILLLERELKLNRMKLIQIQDVSNTDKEYRGLIIQRSNLKDMLIEAYRNEVLERRSDYEYASGT